MSAPAVLNVLYVSAVDVSLPDGPGVNEREFLLELLRRPDLDAHAVLPKPRNRIDELPTAACTFVGARRGRVLGMLRQQWSFYRACEQVTRERSIDLIIVRLSVMPAGIGAFLRRTRIPYVIKTLGGGVIDTGSLRETLSPVVSRVVMAASRQVVKPVVEKAVCIDACTTQLRERVLQSFDVPAARVLCIENATNTDRFRPRDAREARRQLGLAPDARVIGFVGGRPWERGGTEMVRMAPAILAKHPDVHFVVVGGGAGMPQLEALAAELGVSAHFTFPGLVPYDLVPTYINAFDVGVSLDKPGRDEQVGNSYQKLRQYLASGVPTVSNDKTDIDLEALGMGTAVAPGDLEGFGRALLQWLDLSAEQRRAFQEKAHAFAVENLSVSSTLNRRMQAWVPLAPKHSNGRTEGRKIG